MEYDESEEESSLEDGQLLSSTDSDSDEAQEPPQKKPNQAADNEKVQEKGEALWYDSAGKELWNSTNNLYDFIPTERKKLLSFPETHVLAGLASLYEKELNRQKKIFLHKVRSLRKELHDRVRKTHVTNNYRERNRLPLWTPLDNIFIKNRQKIILIHI